ncbi:Mov34/MPN/PAD-1 family protein [Longimicrobium sp.]|uniref:Mov34/MPN/PAD-1 family protein n=1 Tax=Longimicrobium sp. TaxID=2029185 RepID=UPI002F93D742
MADLLTPPGEPLVAGGVVVPKAAELVWLLKSETLPYVRLVECRRAAAGDVVVFEVEPEVPQAKVHDIQRVERLAVVFADNDEVMPETIALRRDFPSVPHLNLRWEELPRSLCLWDETYSNLKLRWTAAAYLRRVLEWLALTARGELHGEDQPLEPLLGAAAIPLILPARLFAPGMDRPAWLSVQAVDYDGTIITLIAEPGIPRPGDGARFVALPFHVPVQTHGVVRRQPQTLAELHDMLLGTGFDLLAALRAQLGDWAGNGHVLGARVILIFRIPKRRNDEAEAEVEETWAFLTVSTVREVGVSIGRWDLHDGTPGVLLAAPAGREGQGVNVEILNPATTLTADGAAWLNGLPGADGVEILAVGAGALGSQVMINLIRAGYGTWTVVDPDRLMPHNLARHYLGSYALGFPKAQTLSDVANALLDGPDVMSGIVADVRSEANPALRKAVDGASVIADFSASVTAARHLALDNASGARRVSVFLNPDGTDLVVLAEDAERRTTLDQLEMQYYREIIQRAELSEHLTRGGQRLRYAHSCRDVTSTIPQDAVGTLSGVAARAFRAALSRPEATIAIFRTDADLCVDVVRVDPVPGLRVETAGWTLCTDEMLLSRLRALRATKLPNETGGVLIGSYDLQRRIVYVVDTIPSPPDSKEWPTLYIRGSEGLRQAVQEVDRRTAGSLQYVGEWHSHPDGYGCGASEDDRKVFGWMTAHLSADGLPGLMIIVGAAGQTGIYLGQI